MSPKDVEKSRQQLLQKKLELQQLMEAGDESGETVVLDQSRVGRLSRMDALQAQQMALETARRRKQQLQKVEGALLRIESGDFGVCFVCGEEIEEKRLAIDATSTRCLACRE